MAEKDKNSSIQKSESEYESVNDMLCQVDLLTQETALGFYDDWALTYDKDLRIASYNGPRYTAEGLASVITEKRDTTKIMDIAAGTGMVGEELAKLGFHNIDALDPSSKSLEVARGKNVYSNFICTVINDKRIDIPDETYDCITISGCLAAGHMPAIALYEILRILKSGGVISLVICFDTEDEYTIELHGIMKDFEMHEKWKKLDETPCERYYLQNKQWHACHRFLYRKL